MKSPRLGWRHHVKRYLSHFTDANDWEVVRYHAGFHLGGPPSPKVMCYCQSEDEALTLAQDWNRQARENHRDWWYAVRWKDDPQ